MSDTSNTARPKVLLCGNGINRCFDVDSWKDVIESILKEEQVDLSYEQIENIPAPMQVVIASNDHVDKHMIKFAKRLRAIDVTDTQKTLLKRILDIKFDSIITTNYSFEFEQAAGIPNKLNAYYKCRHWTKQDIKEKEKLTRLYEYTEADENKIWHIHGDICTPRSIVMGHYYYGKLLSAIEGYSSTILRRVNNKDKAFEYKSWVDYFVTSDVYIVGFGMDLSESDLWWLLCYKHRHFPDTKVYYYQPDIEETKQILLETYGVEIISNPVEDKNYYAYYEKVIKEISDRNH